MKKKVFLARILGILLVFGLVLIGCPTSTSDNGGGGDIDGGGDIGGGGSNPLIGTWETIVNDRTVSYTFSANTLTIKTDGSPTGTYSYTRGSSSITLSNGQTWPYYFEGTALYVNGNKFL